MNDGNHQHLPTWLRPAAPLGLMLLAACATNGVAPQPEPAASSHPSAPVYRLSDIFGAKPDAIDMLLGPPALTRREGDGEYRRYPLTQCELIVILYPDEGGEARAAFVDAAALTSNAPKPDLESCLAAG